MSNISNGNSSNANMDVTNDEDEDLTVIRVGDGDESGTQTPKAGWRGTIAVDMDDVLCQTNQTIVDMHNDMFKTEPPMTLDDFKHYLYWQNRGWGTPTETVEMVTKLYANGLYMRAMPIPGAKEGLLELKRRGYRLIIITARSERQRQGTEEWLSLYLPSIFDELHFTGAFQHLDQPTPEESKSPSSPASPGSPSQGHFARKAILSHHKRSKAEVVHQTGSLLLIDDSADNAYEASQATPPVRVLLFGRYPWNAVVRRPEGEDDVDKMTYVEWVNGGLLGMVEERRERALAEGWLPDGVERVGGWEDVLGWFDRFEAEAGGGR